MIKIVAYEPEHIANLRLRPEYEAVASSFALPNGRSVVERFMSMGTPLTIVGDNGAVLAVASWVQFTPGVVDVYMYASSEIYSQPREYLRFARKNFQNFVMMILPTVRRIQTMSYADERHDKWMRWLGFSLEGTLHKYSPDGSDARVWAIVGE